jgi:glutaredoxin-related protein
VPFPCPYSPFSSFHAILVHTPNPKQNMKEGADIQSALQDITGQRTVPNVFVKGKHIGGNDATQAAIKNGSFQAALKK